MIVIDNVNYEGLELEDAIQNIQPRIDKLNDSMNDIQNSVPDSLSRQFVEIKTIIDRYNKKTRHYVYKPPPKPILNDFENKFNSIILQKVKKSCEQAQVIDEREYEKEYQTNEKKIDKKIQKIKQNYSTFFDQKRLQTIRNNVQQLVFRNREIPVPNLTIQVMEKENERSLNFLKDLKNEVSLIQTGQLEDSGNVKMKDSHDKDNGEEEEDQREEVKNLDFSKVLHDINEQVDTMIDSLNHDLEGIDQHWDRIEEKANMTQDCLNSSNVILGNIIEGLNGNDDSSFELMDKVDELEHSYDPESSIEQCKLLESKSKVEIQKLKNLVSEVSEIVHNSEDHQFQSNFKV